jgi:hypothetical protein
MVIISNVVAGHRDFKKIDDFSCWEMKNYFNYFLVNPFSLKNKKNNEDNMYKIYQDLKRDGTLNNINQSNEFLMILSKIYKDFHNVEGITEEKMILETIDYIYNKPFIYSYFVENIYYFMFAKKINTSSLSQEYSYVNDIVPNNTLEFDSFRDRVVEFYKGENIPIESISAIYGLLFNDYICHKYAHLANKIEHDNNSI